MKTTPFTLLSLLRRNLAQHAASSAIAASGVALATGLVLAVLVLRTQAHDAFVRNDGGYDAVLGARGSKLQLVLNAVFHLESSPGNLPEAEYRTLAAHPGVRRAVPLALGDHFQGWRIAGTTPEFFGEGGLPVPAETLPLAGGRLFRPGAHEAVLGSLAAERLGFGVGAHFHPSHGVGEQAGGAHEHEHDECYDVVGILAPTGTPVDRVIWIPLQGIQTMSGHDPLRAGEISAVLLRFKTPMTGLALDRHYNREGDRFTLAFPVGAVVADLLQKFGWAETVLGGIAWLVAFASAGTIFACLHASLRSRRRDIAILRMLGARRSTVFALLLGEAGLIGAVGVAAGALVFAVLAAAGAGLVRARTGVVLCWWQPQPVFLWVPAVVLALSLAAGLLPAWLAYRQPVLEHLAPES